MKKKIEFFLLCIGIAVIGLALTFAINKLAFLVVAGAVLYIAVKHIIKKVKGAFVKEDPTPWDAITKWITLII